MRDDEFAKVLKQGEKYEKLTIKHYQKRGFTISEYEPGTKKSEYDFKVQKGDKIQLIEVKSDRWGYKTGNLAIEFRSNGINSGISITKAKYYIYYIVNGNEYEVYKLPVRIIKQYIDERKYFRTIKCGHNYLSECYLFKINIFQKYKIKLKI